MFPRPTPPPGTLRMDYRGRDVASDARELVLALQMGMAVLWAISTIGTDGVVRSAAMETDSLEEG
jgi:hypothetical protein